MTTLTQRILDHATHLGFDLVNVAPAVPLPGATHLQRWLELGYHGDMLWMERNQHLRTDPTRLVEGARSVVVVAMLYGHPGDGPIARYARGLDYHDVMKQRLRALAHFVIHDLGLDVPMRSFVDSAPLLERDLAVLAALGWLGKNALVINQKLGSYLLLGELCIAADLEHVTTTAPERCGSCTRCLDACPTGALVEPRTVDARRCISYLTIELRGPIPRQLREPIGLHLFGCDICQAVCPWNRKAPATPHDAFAPLPEVANLSLVDLLAIDDDEFRARFRKSPLWRPRRHGLARNACVVLGNLGDPDAIPALTRALTGDPHPLVRGHAAWALGRLGQTEALSHALDTETEPDVLEELRAALEEATASGAAPPPTTTQPEQSEPK